MFFLREGSGSASGRYHLWGGSAAEIKQDFEEAIDHYLDTCRERGIKPEKPYNGKFVLRMTPDLHGRAAERAADLGQSINDFINDAVRTALG